ncbi:hypothetical protein FA95DRAFT_28846 [Auriscalpium vulgare]|uniref:Uncharacterized protein n=1 Tax=Auriscalpium vulgare TaxID=40419 RepID=A0ACB8SDP7_9AGAM|nr:hypothetical protein FA95DRAFT_28846 [Auriscalpium vulgare]
MDCHGHRLLYCLFRFARKYLCLHYTRNKYTAGLSLVVGDVRGRAARQDSECCDWMALGPVTKRVERFALCPCGLRTSATSMSLDDPQRDLIVAVDAPPSPSSSTSSINDDNPMGRVYFGPLQSPEKKYVAKAARTRTPPPVRRSPRLSAAPQMSHSRSASPSEVEEEAVLVALGDARQTESASDEDGTPENDRAGQDDMEPSSTLASKITRAHDNPSPPPRMQGLQPPDDDSTPASPSPRLIDISPSPEKEVSGATPRSNLPPPIFPSMPLDPPIPSSPLPVSVPNGAEARADLISFDIAGTPTQSTSRVSPSRNTPTPAQTQSVNLLSPSPVRAWTRPFPEDSSATGLSIQPDRVDKGKGRAVDPEHTLQPATDSTKSETVHALTPVRATTLLSVAPPSTLRRSPRLERASPSPGKAPLPSLGMMPSLDVGTSRKASPPKPSSRPVSPSRRSPDAAAKKAQLAAARLGSLSPNSNGVLANLLTTAAELMTGSEQPHESPVLPSFPLPPNTENSDHIRCAPTATPPNRLARNQRRVSAPLPGQFE